MCPLDLRAGFPDTFRSKLFDALAPNFLSWDCPKIAPPPTSPEESTPGSEILRSSCLRARAASADHVPPAWFLTTSTVCSSPGVTCLRMPADHGVRHVSAGCEPTFPCRVSALQSFLPRPQRRAGQLLAQPVGSVTRFDAMLPSCRPGSPVRLASSPSRPSAPLSCHRPPPGLEAFLHVRSLPPLPHCCDTDFDALLGLSFHPPADPLRSRRFHGRPWWHLKGWYVKDHTEVWFIGSDYRVVARPSRHHRASGVPTSTHG